MFRLWRKVQCVQNARRACLWLGGEKRGESSGGGLGSRWRASLASGQARLFWIQGIEAYTATCRDWYCSGYCQGICILEEENHRNQGALGTVSLAVSHLQLQGLFLHLAALVCPISLSFVGGHVPQRLPVLGFLAFVLSVPCRQSGDVEGVHGQTEWENQEIPWICPTPFSQSTSCCSVLHIDTWVYST